MKGWPLVVALVLHGFSAPAFAEKCLEDWACWEVREIGDRFEFWVRNLKPYVFTASLEVRTRHLRSESKQSNRFEVTEVIPGESSQLVLTLFATRSSRDVWYQDIFYWLPGDADAEHDDTIRYLAPFAPDESYPLVQGFGGGFSHSGGSRYAVDFAMPVGTRVHAARDGTVVETVSHHDRGGSDRRYAPFANYIVVLHEDGTTGEYYHLKQGGVLVEVDQVIKAGDLIGISGNTGFSSLPHLHFAVYRPKPMGEFESLPFRFVDGVATRRRWW